MKRTVDRKGRVFSKWWFILKAKEEALVALETKWNRGDWKLQKLWANSLYFLEWGHVLGWHR